MTGVTCLYDFFLAQNILKCVKQCEPENGFYADVSNKKCIYCDGFVSDKKCVTQCNSNEFMFKRACYSTCPSSLISDKNAKKCKIP